LFARDYFFGSLLAFEVHIRKQPLYGSKII